MKNQETIQQFIQLRSQGLSYTTIAKQLQVARRTLLNWNLQYQSQIRELCSSVNEAFMDSVLASQQAGLQALQERLRRIEGELATRDLATVPTVQLERIAEQLRSRLDHETSRHNLWLAKNSFNHEEQATELPDYQP